MWKNINKEYRKDLTKYTQSGKHNSDFTDLDLRKDEVEVDDDFL